jgi:hypothetical protein
MKRQFALVAGALGALAGCARNAQVESSGEVAAATPANRSVLPAGTTMTTRLNQSLGTSASKEGDQFTATVTNAVVAQNGTTAVPSGAMLYGHVTGLHAATLPTEQAVIRLAFDSISFNGRTFPFDASISDVAVRNESGNPSTNTTVRNAAVGAAAGAVLGGIISGGDLSKMITAGLLGAAAGTAISLGTGTGQAVIPAGTTMTVRSTEEVRVR